jgi:TonB family protein
MMFRGWWIAAGCIVGLLSTLAAQEAPEAVRPGDGVVLPKVVKEVKPVYTPSALRQGIQGIVRVEAVVLPDGTVGAVNVVRSLDRDYGLDDRAVAAVREWRFKPGMRFGAPVPVLVTIELEFTLRSEGRERETVVTMGQPAVRKPAGDVGRHGSLRAEVMYPIRSNRVWVQAVTLAKELGFSFDKKDDSHYVLMTRWKKYDTRRFPTRDLLHLRENDRPLSLQLHLASSPHLEPARLAVGVVLDVERPAGRMRLYSFEKLEQWFLDALSRRIGAAPTPLPANAAGRRELSKRLMPEGVTSRCATEAPPEVMPPMTPPHKLIDVQPMYPGREGVPEPVPVTVEALLTEHGTMTDVKVVSAPPGAPNFETSARAAVGLWRYRPAMAEGCPQPALVTVTVNYRTR